MNVPNRNPRMGTTKHQEAQAKMACMQPEGNFKGAMLAMWVTGRTHASPSITGSGSKRRRKPGEVGRGGATEIDPARRTGPRERLLHKAVGGASLIDLQASAGNLSLSSIPKNAWKSSCGGDSY